MVLTKFTEFCLQSFFTSHFRIPSAVDISLPTELQGKTLRRKDEKDVVRLGLNGLTFYDDSLLNASSLNSLLFFVIIMC